MKGNARNRFPRVSQVSDAFRAPAPGCTNNTARHLATARGQAPSSALSKYYKWWSRKSDRKLALRATTRGTTPRFRKSRNRTPGCSGPRRTPSAGFLVAGQQGNGACALTDWLAEPAPEPMGTLLVVRRAAGWCGGRDGRLLPGRRLVNSRATGLREVFRVGAGVC